MLEFAAVSGAASLILIRSMIGRGVSTPWFQFALTTCVLTLILSIPLVLMLLDDGSSGRPIVDWYGGLASITALMAGGRVASNVEVETHTDEGTTPFGPRRQS